MSREPRIHSAHYLVRHNSAVMLATGDETRVTCLVCLYWLRRYIPLGHRLRKHQEYNSNHRDHWQRRYCP